MNVAKHYCNIVIVKEYRHDCYIIKLADYVHLYS